MSLNADAAADILAACRQGASEAGEALTRAIDAPFALACDEALAASPDAWSADCQGPGLLIVLEVGGQAAVVAIAASTGLLPPWYAAPDATGTSKLTTLAQELGMLLLPEALMPEQFHAVAVADLAAALERGKLASTASGLRLELTSGANAAPAWLLWPVEQPAALADTTTAAPNESAAQTTNPPHTASSSAPTRSFASIEEALPVLPPYTRSLLRIRVPIVVTLARSKQPLSRIVELAPGSIIPFDKSCEDTLSLEVNNREVAEGEAVKVGDKFGLRITSMILPPERFVPLKTQRRA